MNKQKLSRVTEPRSTEQFLELGDDCKLLTPFPMFMGIYAISDGMPCNGCAYGNYEDCPGKKRLYQPRRAKLDEPKVETVREIAARLGISISEVRRRRRIGELK